MTWIQSLAQEVSYSVFAAIKEKKKKKKKDKIEVGGGPERLYTVIKVVGSSRCGAVETNPTRNHEVTVSCGVGQRHGSNLIWLWLWLWPQLRLDPLDW